MADSAAVESAILAKLSGDATLMALIPDVYMDVSPSGKTKLIIVSLVSAHDEPMLEATAFEEDVYLVKAVDKNTSPTTAKSAAARIQVLLHLQPLTVTGFSHMLTRRMERVRYTEVDEINADERWQHQGARYEVFVS